LKEFGNMSGLCESINSGGFKERITTLKTPTKNGKGRKIPKKVIERIEEYLCPPRPSSPVEVTPEPEEEVTTEVSNEIQN
jgi:hypothetical protein